MRIGVLTGGGDVPGLNPCIKMLVHRAIEEGFDVLGIRRGWAGLLEYDFDDPDSHARCVLPLDKLNTRTVDRTGGTFLHTSRTNPLKMKAIPEFLAGKEFPSKEATKKGVTSTVFDMTSQVLSNLERLGIEYLVAIGGDDTLSYAAHLDKSGVKVVAIPKTMDNDVRNTEYCIGFSTAISRAHAAIERQRTTIGSHERIGLFRVFGRDAGYTSLYTAYVTDIRCAIPEHKFDLARMIDLLMEDKRSNPSNYSMCVLSEGAEWAGYTVREYGEADAFGHRKKANVAEDLSEEIKKRVKEETVISDLTYELRSGEPDFIDKLVAATYGNMACDCLEEGTHGVMMAVVNGCFARMPIPDPKLGPRTVDLASMYNIERLRPNYAGKTGFPIFLTRA